MIQQPLNLQKKSPKLAITYICIIACVQLLLHLVCFPFFTVESLQFLKTVTMASLWLFVPLAFITWYLGPGFIKRDTSTTQTELLERFAVHELCFECQVVSLPRSYHCNVCN